MENQINPPVLAEQGVVGKANEAPLPPPTPTTPPPNAHMTLHISLPNYPSVVLLIISGLAISMHFSIVSTCSLLLM